jgi:hypothetical protein
MGSRFLDLQHFFEILAILFHLGFGFSLHHGMQGSRHGMSSFTLAIFESAVSFLPDVMSTF